MNGAATMISPWALDKCVESATMAEIEPVQIPVLVTLL